jgi:hypothetical protein
LNCTREERCLQYDLRKCEDEKGYEVGRFFSGLLSLDKTENTHRETGRGKISPSPDKNRKIEESKNRSWVCPSPTFDFLIIIQTEIKKSKNRRIEESKNSKLKLKL